MKYCVPAFSMSFVNAVIRPTSSARESFVA